MSVASGLSQRNKRPRDQIDRHNVERRGREGERKEGERGRNRGRQGGENTEREREGGRDGMGLLISCLALQVMQATVGDIMKCKLMSASHEGCHRELQMEVSMTTSITSAQSSPPAGADYKCIFLYTSFHFLSQNTLSVLCPLSSCRLVLLHLLRM